MRCVGGWGVCASSWACLRAGTGEATLGICSEPSHKARIMSSLTKLATWRYMLSFVRERAGLNQAGG
jgi:hypothetical protein